jgi:gliding motility-associated-like protein
MLLPALVLLFPQLINAQSWIEDFETGNLAGWTQQTGIANAVANPALNGSFSASIQGTPIAMWSSNNLIESSGRYSYSTRVDLVDIDTDGYFCFQFQDSDNGYLLATMPANSDNPGTRLFRRVSGVYTLLAEDVSNPVLAGEWNSFEIIRDTCSGLIQVSQNGTFLFSVIDNTFLAAGTVAIGGQSRYAYFDDLSFTPSIPMSVSLSVLSESTCATSNDASAEVIVAGGLPPYSILWSNGMTTSNVGNLPIGSVSVDVTDSYGCIISRSDVVIGPDSIVVVLTSNSSPCDGGNSGAVSTVVSGGIAPYDYQWSNGSVNQNPQNLVNGVNTVVVTDSQGCQETESITLNLSSTALTISITGVVHPTCFGDCDGAATATPQGGTAPYSYAWDNGQNSPSILAGCGGTQTVTVTDDNGCVVTESVDLEEPDLLAVNVVTSATSCPGTASGTATLNITGGTAPFAPDWGGEDPNALMEGNYNVDVTDANGCTATAAFTIVQGNGLSLSFVITDNVCFAGSTGQATVTVTNGASPYDILWTDAFGNPLQVSPGTNGLSTLTALPTGVYNVAAADATGCASAATFTITQPAAPLTLTLTPQNLLCHEGADGRVTAAQNGLSPFQYAISDIFGTPVGNAVNVGPHTFQGLSADIYFVTVTDGNGCVNTDIVELTQPMPITAEGVVTPISCFGSDNGSVQIVNIAGGTAPFGQTTWSPVNQVGNVATDLPPGNVTATVVDVNGCQFPLSFQLTQPPEMRIAMDYLTDTCGLGKGAAIANVSFGTPPYNFLWDSPNAGTAFRENNLLAGVYAVTVTDANGCTATDSVQVLDDLPYPMAAFTSVLEGETVLDQEVQFINNSVGTISYAWNFGDGVSSDEEDPRHSYSAEGDYLVQLLASNGFCADTAYGYVNIDPLLVVYVPNTFTPGINGINDTFYPQGEGIEEESYDMFIYDRWGKLVWRTGNFYKRWNGTHMSSLEPVPVGVYTWLIRFREFADNDRYELKGIVHVVRD